MPIGKHEAIAVGPLGVRRIMAHELMKEQVRHGRIAQRRSRVPAVSLLYGVYGQKPQRIDRQLIQFAHNNLTLPLENTSVCCSRVAAPGPFRLKILFVLR
jgi:hypothetical protein